MTSQWRPPAIEIRAGASRVVFYAFVLSASLFTLALLGCLTSAELAPIALVLMGPLVALCWGAAALVNRRASVRRISVHPEGVREVGPKGTREIGFDQIEAITVRGWDMKGGVHGAGLIGVAANAIANGASVVGKTALPYDATALTITISGAGQKIVLKKWDKRWLEAYTMIRERAEPRLLERARTQLRTAGAANFGAIAVNTQGIAVIGKQPILWNELAGIQMNWMLLTLSRRGKLLPGGRAPMKKVENVHVLLALSDELKAPATPQA